MVRGLYSAATGMTVQRNRMDVLTNNIVNAETTGFKSDSLHTSSFDEVMLKRINDPNVSIYGGSDVGAYDYGTHIDELVTDFSEGNFEQTGKPTDLAIQGEGFFAVETPNGERYTRAGNFTVNSEGYLVTGDGNYVLGENGRIYVGSDKFTVSADGTVTGSLANRDKLKTVTFSDLGLLRKEGNNLYYAYGGAAAVPAKSVVQQGVQEGSNVDISDEMVDMLTVYRKYEASQKITSMTDDSLELAVNLGKVGG
ncbi:Flagellar basal-body rod protein FlgG [bioreactor metagenome]|uniref:Flagellar basal-body rod protein FlgG n=1 Tax=bioreactor metagenome TaxID=1076179 RepID=A0A644Z655_9ZZZZ